MSKPKQDLVQVQLTVNITFDANGEDHEWLRANAHKAVTREFGNGGITGASDAVVEDYSIEAKILSPEAAALNEASLTKWFSQQIEDGHIELERVPLLMARYALADTVSVREEIAERMQGVDGDHNDGNEEMAFLIVEGWSHIFPDGSEKNTRWVIDRKKQALIAAQLENGLKWNDLMQAESEDLAGSLRTNKVFLNEDPKDLHVSMPKWADSANVLNISLSTALTPTGPRILATFIPEAWIKDHAYALDDGRFTQDVTNKVLAMDADSIRKLNNDSDESDSLVEHNHSGPFSVLVKESVEQFFGVNDITEVTGEMVEDARKRIDESLSEASDLQLIAPQPPSA